MSDASDAIPDASAAQPVEAERALSSKGAASGTPSTAKTSVAARVSHFTTINENVHQGEKPRPAVPHGSTANKFREATNIKRCPVCSKAVYQVEELHALGHVWHKSCFKCGGANTDSTIPHGCSRVLTNKQNFEAHHGQPYCTNCAQKWFRHGSQFSGAAPATIEVSASADVEAEKAARKQAISGVTQTGIVARRASNIITQEAAKAAAQAQAQHPTPGAADSASSNTDGAASGADGASATAAAAASRKANVDKFRDRNYLQTVVEKCVCCQKAVYKAEELRSFGSLFHKSCFVCGGAQEGVGCKRVLANENYEFNGNIPYCKACYLKNFMGASRGAIAAKLVKKTSPNKKRSVRIPKGVITPQDIENAAAAQAAGEPIRISPRKEAAVEGEAAAAATAEDNDVAAVENVELVEGVYEDEEEEGEGEEGEEEGEEGEVYDGDEVYYEEGAEQQEYEEEQPGAAADQSIVDNFDDQQQQLGDEQEQVYVADGTTGVVDYGDGDAGDGGDGGDGNGEAETYAEYGNNDQGGNEDLAVRTERHSYEVTSSTESTPRKEQVQGAGVTFAEAPSPSKPKRQPPPRPNGGGSGSELVDNEGGDDEDGSPRAATRAPIRTLTTDSMFSNDSNSPRGSGGGGGAGAFAPKLISNNTNGFRVWKMTHQSDFDENGILYFIGTQGLTKLYRNPHTAGFVIASMSSVYRGSVHNVCARNIENGPSYTENALNSWCKIDFGPRRFVLPTAYTIRHGGSSAGNVIRNWRLQGKVSDQDDWVTLRKHINDSSVEPHVNASATFSIDIPEHLHGAYGFRYLRISQNDKNSSGNNCLFCCGLEFYGNLFEKV